ncbi:MAG: acriflavin resistance protein, partial [Myxococcales bacterium]|nr:acriflavin resistance protein [Myxococcales bacterium]
MKLLELLLSRPRLTLALTLLASAGGAFAWFTMPREEDPRLAERMGLLVVPYPGAEPADIERHVVEPIEDALSEVDSVEEVAATLRTGIAILSLELRPDVAAAETDRAWDEVEDALADARRLMPDEVLPGELDHALVDTESVLLALHGPSDVLALSDAADALEDRLLGLDDVSRVERAGDPGERVLVDLDDAAARRLGLDPLSLGQLLARRNVTTPGGALQLDGRRLLVRPLGDLRSVEEIAALPLPRPDGSAVPLGSVARVRRATDGPLAERVRHESSPAIVLGVVPRRGLQAERFGEAVQARVDAFAAAHPELEIATLAFQPARVKARLGELGGSLLLGVGIVAAIVFLLMGVRMGLVVASVVPLVTFASLTVYAASGGVLHQMAVAALVVALGLLVDNAIVVAETIQRRLDEGQAPGEAARASVRELALPLGAATGTTLASFVPMLLAEGTTGDFTRAIPVVVMLTLGVSYGYALLVTPLLARLGLRPRPARASRVDALGARLGAFAARRPGLTLLVALGLLGASGAFATQVRFDFFPSSDRNQLVIEVELPEGSHLEATDEASRRLEAALRARPEVTAVTAFVGRSVPSFYYNLPRRPAAPHVAQLLVTTRAAEDVDPVLRFAEELPRREGAAMPDAQVLARRLEQGPPVRAPIEIRLYGDDLADLQLASDEVRRALRATPGARSVRADHGPGLATLRVAVDDAAAARQGVDRAAVAVALLGHARGLSAGTYRGGDDPAPIVVRSSARGSERGEHQAPLDLTHADVPRPGRSPVPLAQVGRATLDWQPAVIHRRGRQRVVGVLAEHEPDVTYASVVSAVTPKLEALELPEGVSWEMAGAFGESAKANAALGAKGPLAALLLVLILLAEFDSFRRVLIVLATAPLAFLGVWPGLALLGLPFGFVALLGAIALIGIAVNGAIVLLDVADRRRREGASVAEALEEAVRLRARPILLTTATTVAGLLPLLASE